MFRVFLIPTEPFGKKELWLNAFSVEQSECGDFWDFLGQDGGLIRRLAKSGVRSFQVTPDRRKPGRAENSVVEELLSLIGADHSVVSRQA